MNKASQRVFLNFKSQLSVGEVGGAYYGASHPMKPHRICMAHHLILGYGLHKHMEVYVRLLTPFFFITQSLFLSLHVMKLAFLSVSNTESSNSSTLL